MTQAIFFMTTIEPHSEQSLCGFFLRVATLLSVLAICV